MFFKMSMAAFSGAIVFNVARIADVAVMLLDLLWLVLAAVAHLN